MAWSRRGIGEARCLHDDRVELAAALHQPLDDADEIAAHGAADAAVVHLEHFLVRADDEIIVDADFAELVDDDGEFLPMVFAEDAVEQGRLATSAGTHQSHLFPGFDLKLSDIQDRQARTIRQHVAFADILQDQRHQ